jgi:hypothetical protein
MLRLPNLEELKSLLLDVSPLVDQLEARDPGATAAIRTWLSTIETALTNNRMAEAADVAGLRAQLVMADRGVLDDGLSLHGRSTPLKIREVSASAVVRAAAGRVAAAIGPDLQRFDEAERLTRQIAIAAQVKGLVNSSSSPPATRSEVVAGWARVLADAEVGQGAVHLVSVVGPEDAVLLFERAIARDAWVGMTAS